MPQINLLKQKPVGERRSFLSLIVKAFLVLLVLMILYYVWLWYQDSQTAKAISQTTSQIQNDKNSALSSKDRNELLTRQQQLADFTKLVGQHVYWSHIFPALASVTLKTANYSNLKISPDGTVTITVQVPSVNDLDKYLQVFDTPEFNTNFNTVRIGSYHLEQNGTSTAVDFEVQMNYSPQLLQYQNPSSGQ